MISYDRKCRSLQKQMGAVDDMCRDLELEAEVEKEISKNLKEYW